MKIQLSALHWLALLLSLLAFEKKTLGQENVPVYRVRGMLEDSLSGQALDFITINLLEANETPVKAGYTKSDGTFTLAGVREGRYTLLAVGVGYKARRIPLLVSGNSANAIDLGKILLGPETVGLKELKVTATRQIVRQEVDRITYDLQADPESKVNSVLDMMRKVPYLALDADNNIVMKGSTDFRILINGKPSSMVERNYKEVLRTIPASTIERIEVITTPPAKYDAEGLAGIINIITNKKLDNGYNGSVNVSERFPAGGPSLGGSFSVKTGKLGMTAMAGANIYNTPSARTWIDRNTIGTDPTFLWQQGSASEDSRGGYFGYEVSYELDTLNLISGQFNLNGNRTKGQRDQSSRLTGEKDVLQQYFLDNRNEGRGRGMDASLNYQKAFRADKNRLLTFSYRYYSFGNDMATALSISDRIDYDLPDYRQVNDQKFAEQTFQLDYVYPIKKWTMEAGLKAILRKNNSDFQHRSWDADKGEFETDPLMSNRFTNEQNVYGAYNTYQYNLKNWSFKAGARLEQTIMTADFVSSETFVKQNYLNLIPSASISRKFKKNNNGINLGYTQRIQRPGIYKLNPFVDRSNPNFERTGNPNLRNELVNDLQLSYNQAKKGSFNISIGGMFFRDLIFQVSTYDAATGINRTTYGNTGSARLLMTQMSFNYPITKKWSYNMNARVAHGKVTGTVNGVTITNSGIMAQVFAATSYRFEKSWRLNANISAYNGGINLQGKSNGASFTSFSGSKDLMKDQLSLSVSVNNPFRKFRTDRRTTSGPDFMQTSFRNDYFRSFNLSVNYKFGKLKDAVKKNKRGIRNDDVQNGG
ncbi:outer membrane beta-barrel family protein [Ravibacter arvi]|uniref:Outer membrane beta-barrel family protein n=1 Tax=Ravibacter arvi TaxID=2051041 RepID=A0ABP8LUM2_9BACT